MQKHIATIEEIKRLMEQSTKFLSLSELSGIFAGIFALIGAFSAWLYFGKEYYYADYSNIIFSGQSLNSEFLVFIFMDAAIVLLLALTTGILFSFRYARKEEKKVFTKAGLRMLINLSIPLATGALLCLILIFKFQALFVVPSLTLIFYGLALINASHYTVSDIRWLGVLEILIGISSFFAIGYGLLFWAVGFGLLHIFYGAIMYFKYERKQKV